jgi:glutamate-1-semialdehyde aminotransferase
VGVTYFAGTFVRHPLALAAMDAVLDFLTASDRDWSAEVDAKAERYVARINKMFAEEHAPWTYVNWGSMMKLNPAENVANLEILVYLLRYRGVHTWDGFPNFFTIAHSDQDIEFIIEAMTESVREMRAAGFFGEIKQDSAARATANVQLVDTQAPRQQAVRFTMDPKNPGQYIAVSSTLN